MTGLDTNVLVRYIVQDDPKQSKLATECIEQRCTSESPGFVNLVVLCELTWVLARGYGYGVIPLQPCCAVFFLRRSCALRAMKRHGRH